MLNKMSTLQDKIMKRKLKKREKQKLKIVQKREQEKHDEEQGNTLKYIRKCNCEVMIDRFSCARFRPRC